MLVQCTDISNIFRMFIILINWKTVKNTVIFNPREMKMMTLWHDWMSDWQTIDWLTVYPSNQLSRLLSISCCDCTDFACTLVVLYVIVSTSLVGLAVNVYYITYILCCVAKQMLYKLLFFLSVDKSSANHMLKQRNNHKHILATTFKKPIR